MRSSLRVLVTVIALSVVAAPAMASVWSFSWFGGQVQGETDPVTNLAGTALFELYTNTLTLTLTTTSVDEFALGHLLSGLLWDQSGFQITNGHDTNIGSIGSADIAAGSGQVGAATTGATNLNAEWAWSDQVASNWASVWSPLSGTIGNYGVSSTGADGGFGSMDLFDKDATNIWAEGPPDGIDASLVSTGHALTTDGLPNFTYISNSMVFTWDVTGVGGGDDTIGNVNALFGTDGAFLIPEPGSLMLLGLSLAGFGLVGRIRRRKN